MIITKKHKTLESAEKEIEMLKEQVVTANASVNAIRRESANSIKSLELQLDNHPAQAELKLLRSELTTLKSKWFVRLFYKSK